MSIKLGISVLAAAVLLLSACTTRSGPPLLAPGPAPHGGPLAAGEQLYTKKTASFSDHWAVQHDCPLDVAIVFSARVGQAVVSVSGSPGMAECRDRVQEARRDARLVRSVAVAELSPGDQFCGAAAGTGHVFLMAVTEATTTEPVEVTWEVTAWAGPSSATATTRRPGTWCTSRPVSAVRARSASAVRRRWTGGSRSTSVWCGRPGQPGRPSTSRGRTCGRTTSSACTTPTSTR